MIRKALATVVACAVVAACVIGAGFLAEPDTGIYALDETSPCPVTACASGECHGFDDVPDPDGVHEMACPEASCSSVECHAWDTLVGGYRQASDASLNLWVLFPVALVVALVVIVKRAGSGGKGGDRHA